MPLPLPPEDAETRDTKPRQRRADEIGDHSEIFGDDLGAGIAKDRHEFFAERHLIRLVVRREERLATSFRPSVGPVEADQVIDSISVVQFEVTPRAFAQPAEIVSLDDLPP